MDDAFNAARCVLVQKKGQAFFTPRGQRAPPRNRSSPMLLQAAGTDFFPHTRIRQRREKAMVCRYATARFCSGEINPIALIGQTGVY